MKENKQTKHPQTFYKVILLVLFVYIFLVSIELLGGSFKLMGEGFAHQLLHTTSNPFIGLLMGIIATSLVQSSSVTTSIVVSMVAGGTLTIRHAIPIVMGANIGTTVTNTMVSMGHITRPVEFRRALSGSTVHDFFNVLAVITFLPLEMFTHYLEHSAIFLQKIFAGVGGLKLISPLKIIVKPAVHLIIDIITSLSLGHTLTAVVSFVVAILLLFFALSRLVSIMKQLIIGKVERLLHGYLFANPIRSLLIGIVLTAIVQSSSIITSLVVPIVGAGILTVEQIFPYTIGANIGTTVTAIMASLITQNPAAVSTAFVHLLFNISGGIIWYGIPFLRKIPIALSKLLAGVAYKKRWVAILYVVITFYIAPLLLATIIEGG